MLEQAKYIAEKESSDSKRWKCGTHARFLQINSLWGVKFYKKPKTREYTWNLQRIAAKAALAPPVGDWINSHSLRFGYLTMVADIKKHKSLEDIKKLNEKLEELGLHPDWEDCSAMDNAGYFKGRLVSIDFEANWMSFLFKMPNGCPIQKMVRCNHKIEEDVGKHLDWRYTSDEEYVRTS